ncbi:Contig2860.g3064 [Symbiodinium microadriaticum]|nr:Contig2860.g3064 [Symbiodinium microadriaticum]
MGADTVILNSPGLVETLNWHVSTVYDERVGTAFNFIYDVLQFSSGRDKFCALMQGYCKFASEVFSEPDSERHWMYRGMEDSLSDGRKIFRLFKEFREVYKVRRGWSRFSQGAQEHGTLSVPAACGVLDMLGHTCSFFYYLGDNLLWAASVGLVRSKEVPQMQRRMWKGFRPCG